MLTVEQVIPDSPAAGKLQPGDILIRMNGELVTEFIPLAALLDDTVGGEVEIELERAGPDAETGYDFAHDRLRAVVYEETSAPRRRLLHRRVAEAVLSRSSRHGTARLAATVAHHFRMAGQEVDAALHFRVAADHARSVYANSEALRNYQSALELGHREVAANQEAAGDMQTLLGRYADAVTSYERAASMGSPEGVAAFAVCALNESSSPYAGGQASTPEEAAMITALDFGREFFANIVGMAIYVLPPDGTDDTGGMPIPDVALVFTVNDPSKSEALWTQVLGIAHLANGGKSMAGGTERIGGVDVATYVMEHGVTLHFASMGNEVLISPSRSAVVRSIAAKKSGRSILDDKELAGHARALASGSTKAFFGHIGRCAEIAKRFMPPRDLEKAAPLIEALSKTTVSIVVDYGESALNISAGVRGVPKIGGLLSAMLDAELGNGRHSAHAMRR